MKKDIDLDLVGEELLDQQAGHRETRDLSLHVIPGYDDVLGLTVVTSQGGASESSSSEISIYEDLIHEIFSFLPRTTSNLKISFKQENFKYSTS